jgi:hypothetical protein
MTPARNLLAKYLLLFPLIGIESAQAQEPSRDSIPVKANSSGSISNSSSEPNIEDQISTLVDQEKYRDLIALMNSCHSPCKFLYEDFDSYMSSHNFQSDFGKYFKRFTKLKTAGIINDEESLRISKSKNKQLSLYILQLFNLAAKNDVNPQDFNILKKLAFDYLKNSPALGDGVTILDDYNTNFGAVVLSYSNHKNINLVTDMLKTLIISK